jgi:hypothetical protein
MLLLGSIERRAMHRRSTSLGSSPDGPLGWNVVPKPGGGSRRLVVLDPADEMAFGRSLIRLAPCIRRALGPESHASRLAGWDPRRGLVLEPWTHARRRWHREVRRLEHQGHRVAVTDVRECYASIASEVVEQRLSAIGAPEDGIDKIRSWLRAFLDAGVEGLPVGPVASAVLADVVLAAGDDALRATGARFIRWVDDVAIFAPDRRARAAALDALRAAWAPLGLEMHERKTVFLDDPGHHPAVSLGEVSTMHPATLTLRDNRAT